MTTYDLPNSDVLFTEASASWNTKCVSPEGFECQPTLRGKKGQDLLKKANGANIHLLNAGCKPYAYNRGNSHSQSSNSSSGNGGANGSIGAGMRSDVRRFFAELGTHYKFEFVPGEVGALGANSILDHRHTDHH
jgi:hypothetical protein